MEPMIEFFFEDPPANYGDGNGSGYGSGSGSGSGSGDGYGDGYGYGSGERMQDHLHHVRQKCFALLSDPIPDGLTERALDAAISQAGVDGDEVTIVWSTQRPRRDAIAVDGLSSKQIPCLILENRTCDSNEAVKLCSQVGLDSVKVDGRSGKHWIVLKLRHLKGLRAWAVVDKSAVLGEDPTTVIHKHGDLLVFELETEGQLVREGRLAKHCIGSKQMSYRKQLAAKTRRFLSVRSALNKSLPIATAEVGLSGEILQLQGRSNSCVSDDVKEAILACVSCWGSNGAA